MIKIEKKIYREKNLTVYTVAGSFLYDKIVDTIKQFYASEYTMNLLFDLTDADMSSITAHEIQKIITLGKKYAHLRKGGKTAFVMSTEANYGLARMYEIYSEVEKHSILHSVFKNIDDAKNWLEN